MGELPCSEPRLEAQGESIAAEGTTSVIERLKQLGNVDAAIARITAERKKLTNELNERLLAFKKGGAELLQKRKVLADRQEKFRREEKSIKEERDKLVDRRKALSTLNNYKLQQAGEREIEHASRQISVREEALLATLEELEQHEDQVKKLEEFVISEEGALKELRKEVDEGLARLEERETERSQERAKIVISLSPADLSTYERIRERFPGDAIIAIQNNACTGCFIQVAPQLLVQIAMGDKIVRCRGCGRILFNSPPPA